MSGIRGIVICVNYDDLLSITLPRNMRFLDECIVVTSPADEKTKAVCAGIERVRVFETNAFYEYGAKFNKGLAMEQGFEFMGREGWILIWDADILFPDDMADYIQVDDMYPTRLYGARRRILHNPKDWTPDFNWQAARPTRDRDFPGFYQLFNASDPHIQKLPWYDVTFAHAGGGDGYFATRWPWAEKMRMPFDVLHLGPRDSNWFGRVSERIDGGQLSITDEDRLLMQKYLSWKGWGTRQDMSATFDHEHVNVPGTEPSGFRLLADSDHPKPQPQ